MNRSTPAGEQGRRYWDRNAKRYDASMRLLGGPLGRMLDLTRAGVAGAGEVLEVAAGTGLVTIAIAPVVRRLVATDYSASMLNELRSRVAAAGLTHVECAQADLHALELQPGSFDAVVAANVLHLVPDLAAAVAALRRVLRPGGKLVVPTFCHGETVLSRLVSRVVALTGFPGLRRLTSRALRAALEREGLRVTRQETIAGVIPISYLEGTFEEA